MDVYILFGKLTDGQANNMGKALNAFLTLELDGMNIQYLDSLRKAIPAQTHGIDNEVPPVEAIVATLAKLHLPNVQISGCLFLVAGPAV